MSDNSEQAHLPTSNQVTTWYYEHGRGMSQDGRRTYYDCSGGPYVRAGDFDKALAQRDAAEAESERLQLLIDAMEGCIGPREGQTFEDRAEELIVTEVQHQHCSALLGDSSAPKSAAGHERELEDPRARIGSPEHTNNPQQIAQTRAFYTAAKALGSAPETTAGHGKGYCCRCDTRHNRVYCPDCGLKLVPATGSPVETSTDAPSRHPFTFGQSVRWVPGFPTQMPLDGWTIDKLPTAPCYVIKHSNGSMLAVFEGEIQVAPSENGKGDSDG